MIYPFITCSFSLISFLEGNLNLQFGGFYVVALLHSHPLCHFRNPSIQNLPQTIVVLRMPKQPTPAPFPSSRSRGSPDPESLRLFPGRVSLYSRAAVLKNSSRDPQASPYSQERECWTGRLNDLSLDSQLWEPAGLKAALPPLVSCPWNDRVRMPSYQLRSPCEGPRAEN